MKVFQILSLLALLPAVYGQERFAGSAALDQVMDDAVDAGHMPGGVLLVSYQGKVVHRAAYGKRALVPAPEPMTVDTIFDAASLTKVLATTPSIMKLVEQGKIEIREKVTRYLPEFQNGRSDITV